MINRRRGLVAVAVLTALIALIVLFPARVAYRLASSPFMAMGGISGTVWRGQAREFSTNGVYLRDLEWRIRPLGLLTGKFAYDVSGSPVSGFFESELAVGLGGTVTLSGLSASVPLQMLERAAGVAGLRGMASLQFERLEIVDGRAVAFDGTIDVANLVVPLVARSSLGGYRAEFFTQEDSIVASIEDTDGVVDLAGSLRINPDKSYAFVGYVAARTNTPNDLAQRLRFLPETDRPGQRELRLEGTY
ncbi:MAG: type II secretion system protein N [Gammaproteobacteria bacterium]|nr:type II secretion system protein N [Gammaproteobacteria bacterium]NNF48642.1 type II secretion system protein N [Woeseiaceae bacterium]MBT8095261.1 type II secretion system protein N [Gammaproteobacteria bacterium]MBT8105084.1 type II secretion system protein N [Gammaproteobacteria bacterium]NNK25098.1 type II secretion system protein N [Woeseiaceae bacterium]